MVTPLGFRSTSFIVYSETNFIGHCSSTPKQPTPIAFSHIDSDAGYLYTMDSRSENLADIENSGCMREVKLGIPVSSTSLESSRMGIGHDRGQLWRTPPQLACITVPQSLVNFIVTTIVVSST